MLSITLVSAGRNEMKLYKMHVFSLTNRNQSPKTMLPAITIQTTHTWRGTLSQIMFWFWPNAIASCLVLFSLTVCFIVLNKMQTTRCCFHPRQKTFSNMSKLLEAADDKLGVLVKGTMTITSELQRIQHYMHSLMSMKICVNYCFSTTTVN